MSPEERLLRLIKRGPKKEKTRAEKPEASSLPEEAEKRPNGIAHALNNNVAKAAGAFSTILVINRVLFGVFAALLIYFLVDYFFAPPVEIQPARMEELDIAGSIRKKPVMNDYSYYEKEVRGKDVFKPIIKEAPKEDEADDEEIENIIANLSLLGVISGETPQAIIQDNRKKKTFFMNAGDSLGEVELKEISEAEGTVLLIYKGRQFNLGL